jgi:hypothetical protein
MRIFVVGLALAFGLTVSMSAAPVSTDTKSKAVTPAEKAKAALDKVIDFDLDNQPLHLALNQLKEQTGISFVLDRFTIQQMGMDPEQIPITFKSKGIKVRTGLRSIIGQFNLSFAIVGDNVVITTDEMAMYRQMRQRVNVDFEGVEYAVAIKQLSRETATNLIIDPRVAKEAKGTITLQLDDVPLESAVRLMSEMVSLKPVRHGNAMFICSKATAAELRNDPDFVPPVPNPGGPMGPGGFIPGIGIVPGVGIGQIGVMGFGALGGPMAVPALPPAQPQPEKTTEAPKEEPKPEPKPEKN